MIKLIMLSIENTMTMEGEATSIPGVSHVQNSLTNTYRTYNSHTDLLCRRTFQGKVEDLTTNATAYGQEEPK